MEKYIFLFLTIAVYSTSANPFESSNRIINGDAATENQFRYAVSLQQIEATATATRGHRCGGVLVDLQHVVTAASCLFTTPVTGNPQLINPTQYRIFGGSVLLGNDIAERVRLISNFTIHPGFIRGPSFVNDIAVIRLSTPYSINGSLVPLALPPAHSDPEDGTPCTVAGWGASNVSYTASASMRYADKYVYNQDLCTLVFNVQAHIATNILSTMICAASFDVTTSSCLTDMGNALVCNNTLSGILFGNTVCPSLNGHPEIYTRISNYTQWIRDITGSASTFTPGFVMLALLTILQLITAKIVS